MPQFAGAAPTAPQTAAFPPLPPAWTILKQAWAFYRDHWAIIFGIAIVPVILNSAQIFAGKAMPAAAAVGLGIIAFVVSLVARVALFDAVAEGGEPAGGIAGAYQKGLRLFFPFFWISALSGIAVWGGFIAFFIPGLLLSIWLVFSLYVLLAENKRGLAALAASWHYVKGYWGAVFVKLLFFGVIVLGAVFVLILPIGAVALISALGGAASEAVNKVGQIFNLLIGDLVVAPLGIIYSFLLYQSLRYLKAQAPAEADEPKFRKAIIAFIIVGIVGTLLIVAVASFLVLKVLPEWLPNFRPNFLPPENIPTTAMSRAFMAGMSFAPALDFLSFGR